MDSWMFILLFVFESNTIVIDFADEIVQLWQFEVLSGWVICHALSFLGNTSLTSGSPDCSRLIFYLTYPSTRINHCSKDSRFPLLENQI